MHNCCSGKKGYNYFSADDIFICEGEYEYVSEGENDLYKSMVAFFNLQVLYVRKMKLKHIDDIFLLCYVICNMAVELYHDLCYLSMFNK